MKRILREIFLPVFSVMLALVLAGLVIEASGLSPMEAYRALFKGSLGTPKNITETLFRSIPLILTGLSVAVAFRSGLFNIGGEGQFLMGGLLAMAGGALLSLPAGMAFVHLPLCLLLGFLGGAATGALPGWLKARFGVHEVINTIMLNWICLNLVRYLVNGPFRDPSGQGTPLALPSAVPPLLFSREVIPGGRLHVGFLVAVFLVLVVAFYLYRTVSGYALRAVGLSPLAAEYGGISMARTTVLALFLAGGLSGIAGAFEYLGNLGRIPSTLDFPGYGFQGIAVALVGKTNPFGVLGAALLFGALEAGAGTMQLEANVPKDLIAIVQALVIMLVIAPAFAEAVIGWFQRKKDPEGLELSP